MESLTSPLSGLDFDEAYLPSLAAARRAAWESFIHQGIPTTNDEAYKYTSLKSLSEGYFLPGGKAILDRATVDSLGLGDLDAYRLVFVNGQFAEDISDDLSAVSGVEFTSLAIHGNLTALPIGSLANPEKSPFIALNTATFRDGGYLRISKDTKIEKPILVINVTTSDPNDVTTFGAPRLFIQAESGSDATVIELFATVGDGPTFTNPVTEIAVEPDAHLEHVKVQIEYPRAIHIGDTEVRQEKDSAYNGYTISFGGRLTRNDLNVFLNGSNIHSRMDGVVVINGEQHVDNHTRLDHAFPHCDSFEVYKHVLGGRSQAVFNGQIYVHQDAQKTDAKQTNQTLLLSPTAVINSKPQLEIFADDVKCTHGATIGDLDQEPMFYLQSRGIPRNDAEALLVYAFAADVLVKIRNHELVQRLEAMLFAKLADRQS